ncbi:MAG: hypothetical protein HWE39_07930 [Oceanospirillaceae bacterium]|nr:hypothetical protein [Oceanospirillaceae bacterium]
MTILFGILIFVIWLNVGIIAERSMSDLTGGSELPYINLPLRIAVILLSPILFLVFERHLFYSSSDGLSEIEDDIKHMD